MANMAYILAQRERTKPYHLAEVEVLRAVVPEDDCWEASNPKTWVRLPDGKEFAALNDEVRR